MAQIFKNIDNTEVIFSSIGTDRVDVFGQFSKIQLDINFLSGNGQPDVNSAVIDNYNKCRVNINNGQYIGGLGSYLLYCYNFYTQSEQYIYNKDFTALRYGENPELFRFIVDTPQINSISFVNDTPVMITLYNGVTFRHPKLQVHYLTPFENQGFNDKKINVMFCKTSGFEDLLPNLQPIDFTKLIIDGNFSYKEKNNPIFRKYVECETEKMSVSKIFDCCAFDSVHTMDNGINEKLTVIYQENG